MADFEQLEKFIDEGCTDAWWLSVDGSVYEEVKSIQEIKNLEAFADYTRMDALHVSHKESSKWIRIDENYATPSPPSYLRFIKQRFGKAYALIKNSLLICLVGLGLATLYLLFADDDSYFFGCIGLTYIALYINFVVFLFKISIPVYSHKRVNKHEQSVKSLSVIKRNFSLRGRLNRLQYLIATFFKWVSLLAIGGLTILAELISIEIIKLMTPVYVIFTIFLIVFSLSINIRRVHDMGRSAWYFVAFLFILLPINFIHIITNPNNIYELNPLGIVVYLVLNIRLFCAKSQNRQNPYGESQIKLFSKDKGVSANNK